MRGLMLFGAVFILGNLGLYAWQEYRSADDEKRVAAMETRMMAEKSAVQALESDLRSMEGDLTRMEREFADLSDEIESIEARYVYDVPSPIYERYASNVDDYVLVDRYNGLAEQFNNRNEEYSTRVDRYNAAVDSLNDMAKKAGMRWYLIPVPRGATRAAARSR